MNRQEFECDTSDCRFWDEEDGCTQRASITIQEHCCCDFEKRPTDKVVIEVNGGMVQNVYTTLSTDVEVEILDSDDNGTQTDNERDDMEASLGCAKAKLRQIY